MNVAVRNVEIDCPEKMAPLYQPAPYKVAHGGRGGSKSWSFVRALLILGMYRKLFILCAREFQKSIDESVHKLLADQIAAMGLQEHYQVLETEIRGVNGTRFVFRGIRNHIQAIKSMEGIDICAVFEATFISHNSWEALLPTVRRDPPYGPFGQGSEVWVEFNPELTSDYTYQYWVVDPPPGTVVIEINYFDNPWFPEILRKQKDELYRRDPDAANTVWGGRTRRVLKGAIYAKEIQQALDDGRINPNVRYDRSKGVTVSIDLGRADMTSMWFIQQVGMEHNAIDHYSNCGFDFSHYLEVIQERKYIIKLIELPHDATHKHISARKSVKAQAVEVYGANRVKIVKRVPRKLLRINAMRQLFPRFHFNEITCNEGIKSLTHYQYAVNEKGQRSMEPLHNWASHDADALGGYATALIDGYDDEREEDKTPVDPYGHDAMQAPQPQAWMK